MSWKKFFVGEPMPDKNDPKYQERYKREYEAGKKFAEKSGIAWLAGVIQKKGQEHKIGFLVIAFGFVLICFIINSVRLFSAYQRGDHRQAVAVERVDSAMKYRMKAKHTIPYGGPIVDSINREKKSINQK